MCVKPTYQIFRKEWHKLVVKADKVIGIIISNDILVLDLG